MRRILPSSAWVFWPLPSRVAAAAAVAEADVEEAVGAELDVAAVVVGVGLLDGEQLAPASRCRPCRRRIGVRGDRGCRRRGRAVADVERSRRRARRRGRAGPARRSVDTSSLMSRIGVASSRAVGAVVVTCTRTRPPARRRRGRRCRRGRTRAIGVSSLRDLGQRERPTSASGGTGTSSVAPSVEPAPRGGGRSGRRPPAASSSSSPLHAAPPRRGTPGQRRHRTAARQRPTVASIGRSPGADQALLHDRRHRACRRG